MGCSGSSRTVEGRMQFGSLSTANSKRGTDVKEYQKSLRLKLHLRKNHYFKTFVQYNFGTHKKSLDEQIRENDLMGLPDEEYTHLQMVAAISQKRTIDISAIQNEELASEVMKDPEYESKKNNMLVATWIEDPLSLQKELSVSDLIKSNL